MTPNSLKKLKLFWESENKMIKYSKCKKPGILDGSIEHAVNINIWYGNEWNALNELFKSNKNK